MAMRRTVLGFVGAQVWVIVALVVRGRSSPGSPWREVLVWRRAGYVLDGDHLKTSPERVQLTRLRRIDGVSFSILASFAAGADPALICRKAHRFAVFVALAKAVSCSRSCSTWGLLMPPLNLVARQKSSRLRPVRAACDVGLSWIIGARGASLAPCVLAGMLISRRVPLPVED